MEPTRRHAAVVVGAGIAGLAAAWDLRDRDVVVLESSPRLGGRIRSEPRDPYWLNAGAHVFSGPGSATDRLVREVGVEAVEVPGHLVAVELNGRVLVGGRPELYPLRLPLATRERLALARAGLRLRREVGRYERVAALRPGESRRDARRRLLAHGDDRTFADWLGPLPGDAGALFRATVSRSTAEADEIARGQGAGYFALVWSKGGGLSRNLLGGAGVLVGRIAEALGGRIVTGAEVVEVRDAGDRVCVRYRTARGMAELEAEHALLATKAFQAAAVAPGLPADTLQALRSIPYGPTVVLAALTNERRAMPYDDLYALATPKRSFNMFFNIANVLRAPGARRRPGGSLMVYRGGREALALLELDDREIERRFLDDIDAIYPGTRALVAETLLLRLPRMLPYAAPGRSALQPALERDLGRIRLAGDYLGGVYSETAIASGQEAAAAIRAALSQRGARHAPC